MNPVVPKQSLRNFCKVFVGQYVKMLPRLDGDFVPGLWQGAPQGRGRGSFRGSWSRSRCYQRHKPALQRAAQSLPPYRLQIAPWTGRRLPPSVKKGRQRFQQQHQPQQTPLAAVLFRSVVFGPARLPWQGRVLVARSSDAAGLSLAAEGRDPSLRTTPRGHP